MHELSDDVILSNPAAIGRAVRSHGADFDGGSGFCHAPAVAVTSKDIARKLKISQSTVSRALRGDPRVAADTAARVLEAARQMNYTPNLAARSLITRRTGTVGVVVNDITNPFYPELLDILHNELALAGYRTDPLQRADGRQRRAARRGPRQRALPSTGSSTSRRRSAPRSRGTASADIPIVLVNRYIDAAPVDTVVSDNQRGGRLVAEAMVELGHRRIALIAGPENTTTSRDRERGFREQLERVRRTASTRRSAASASSATTAATSGASTSSRPSRGRPPSSPPTT